MGDVYWGIHAPLAALVANAGIRVAVETGTYYGLGTLQLAALFDRVVTIEMDKNLYTFCSNLYRRDGITFVQGQSDKELAQIAAQIDQAAFYFLDAHWFPTPSLPKSVNNQCPLLGELTCLHEARVLEKGSVIMIDDADMFLGSLPPHMFHAVDFPSLSQLVLLLKNQMQAEFIEVLDDVIVAGPLWLEPLVTQYRTYKAQYGGPNAKRVGT